MHADDKECKYRSVNQTADCPRSPKVALSSGSRRLTPSERKSLKKTVRSWRKQTAKEFPNIKFVE